MSLPLPRRATSLLILFAALLGLAAVPAAADRTLPPPPDTIRAIEGDAENGFSIHYWGRPSEFPPTLSEVIAECGEYDTRLARVRCKVEVRTEYRMLARTQQALAWARPGGVPR